MVSAKQKKAARKNIKKALAALRRKRGKPFKRKSQSNKFTRRRYMPKKRKSRRYGRTSALAKIGAQILGAMGYGAIRAKVSDTLSPITSKVPLGDVSDEAVMIATAFMAKKFIGRSFPIIKKVADAGIAIESARIGEAMLSGNILGTTSSNGVGSATLG